MTEYQRKKTRQIHIGPVAIGGGAPISVQSMTNTKTADTEATLAQIRALAQAGCDIVRLAVPDMAAAKNLGSILAASPVPLVADIHFDYKLALEAIAQGIHALRLNPGNIGGPEKVAAVAAAAKKAHIPIRIGVNAGSLDKRLLKEYGGVTAETLVACPTCGRTSIDLPAIAAEVEKKLAGVAEPIEVAVMGCVVNGPGEARGADVGIAGGKGEGLVFRKGEILRKVPECELVPELFKEIDRIIEERKK